MDRLFKRLFRERRRVVIVALVTFLGGYISFFSRTSHFLGLPFSIVAGLAFMVILTAFLMALAILFPKIRHTAESVAVSIPVLSLMGAFSGEEDGGLSTYTSVFGILLCYLIITVYGGAWVDRFLPCRPKQLRSFTTSNLKPDELWPYLTVTPDTFKDYGTADTLSMDWIEPDLSFRVVSRIDDIAKIEEIHTIEVNEPFQHFRFSFEAPDATEEASVSCGTKTLKFIPVGRTTRLETIREFDRVSIRAQLMNWIDDGCGRLDDDLVDYVEAEQRG
ncbi:MAG: hypothetical protein ABJJ69_20040 [Paracoccaceae bacterium]